MQIKEKINGTVDNELFNKVFDLITKCPGKSRTKKNLEKLSQLFKEHYFENNFIKGSFKADILWKCPHYQEEKDRLKFHTTRLCQHTSSQFFHNDIIWCLSYLD